MGCFSSLIQRGLLAAIVAIACEEQCLKLSRLLLWGPHVEFNAGLPGFGDDAAVALAPASAQSRFGRKLSGQENQQANDKQPNHPPNEPRTLRHVPYLGDLERGVKLEGKCGFDWK